jgi:hypothetical protein
MKACIALLALVATPSVAHAQALDCMMLPDLARTDLAIARVLPGIKRVNFRNSAICTAKSPSCERRSYVVAGDALLVTALSKGSACVAFLTPKGGTVWGWLPASALAIRQAATPPTQAQWIGTWDRNEASISFARAPNGRLKTTGWATWGANNPERVARGGINTSEVEGTAALTGDQIAFAIGNDGITLPYEAAPQSSCAIRMRRIGPWLLVDDNDDCGGMNVTFDGIYTKARSR